jgi:hypothetical protein
MKGLEKTDESKHLLKTRIDSAGKGAEKEAGV